MPTAAAKPAGGRDMKDMETRIRDRVACDKAVYDVQWSLLEPSVSEEALEAAAEVLQPSHYADVVEERALDGLCGFPACGKAAPARGQGRRVHVSLSEKKVYDISSLHNFCGRACAVKSAQYAETLSMTSLFLRTGNHAAAAAKARAAAAKAAAATTASGLNAEPTGSITDAPPAAVAAPPPRPPAPSDAATCTLPHSDGSDSRPVPVPAAVSAAFGERAGVPPLCSPSTGAPAPTTAAATAAAATAAAAAAAADADAAAAAADRRRQPGAGSRFSAKRGGAARAGAAANASQVSTWSPSPWGEPGGNDAPTMADVVERDAPAAPNLDFARPVAPGMVEGYVVRTQR